MVNCILVGIGGFIGTVCRYLIGLIPVQAGGDFPIKTLAINVAGSFLISVIAALASGNEGFDSQIALMLRVGVCGGFTTFSTFAYESAQLLKSGHTMAALAYVCLSIVLGMLAIFAAQILIK